MWTIPSTRFFTLHSVILCIARLVMDVSNMMSSCSGPFQCSDFTSVNHCWLPVQFPYRATVAFAPRTEITRRSCARFQGKTQSREAQRAVLWKLPQTQMSAGSVQMKACKIRRDATTALWALLHSTPSQNKATPTKRGCFYNCQKPPALAEGTPGTLRAKHANPKHIPDGCLHEKLSHYKENNVKHECL